MNGKLFCACCGDEVKAAFPCRFIYHDGLTLDLNVCIECMDGGVLEIDLGRKRLVAKIKAKLDEMNVRKQER